MVKGRGSLALVEADLDELARIQRLIGLGAHPERLPRRLRPGDDDAGRGVDLCLDQHRIIVGRGSSRSSHQSE